MTRPTFSIRFLLVITACTCGLMTVVTHSGNWWFALLVSILLANVAAVLLSLGWYLMAILFGSKRSPSQIASDAIGD